MSKTFSESCQFDRELSIIENHEAFLRIAKGALEQNQLTEDLYHSFLLEELPSDTEQAYDTLERLYAELIDALEDYEYNRLLERLTKGAEMIENETDPQKKAKYIKLYEGIENELLKLSERSKVA